MAKDNKGNKTSVAMILWIMFYWIIIGSLAIMIEEPITENDFREVVIDENGIEHHEPIESVQDVFDVALIGMEQMPIVNNVVPLLKLLSFRTTAEIPKVLLLLNSIVFIITAIAFFNFFIKDFVGR